MNRLVIFVTLFVLIFSSQAATAENSETVDEEILQKPGGVEGVDKRIERLEEAVERDVEGEKWSDRITISGTIEVEAEFEAIEYDRETDKNARISDTEASVQLIVDAKVSEHVDGHITIEWEDEELILDEGFILISGDSSFPAYLIAGHQTIPFGNYDSFFLSDPTTLILGETSGGAAVAGYRIHQETLVLSAGVYNGKVKIASDDDVVDNVVAAMYLQPFKDLKLGFSYTTSLAASDEFSEFVVDPENMQTRAGGISAFLTWTFFDRLTFIGEYVGAVEAFEQGDIYDDAANGEYQPSAWNTELGLKISDAWEIAFRYGGSDDGGAMMHQKEFGAVVNWSIIDNTNIGFEYLHGTFQNDIVRNDRVAVEFAINF